MTEAGEGEQVAFTYGVGRDYEVTAASFVSKTILHLDPNSFYDNHLLLSPFMISLPTSLPRTPSPPPQPPPHPPTLTTSLSSTSSTNPSYLEFKGIDESFIYEANTGLSNVPDSRGAIFRDKMLSLKEKNQLMRFFKLV
ncbi:Rab escort protein 1 [Glycine max]|nr:Rab escort protein 1 [Glycine max]